MLGDIRDERARAKRTVIGVNIGIELDCCAATAALRDGRGLGLNIAELVGNGAAKIEFLNRRAVDVDVIFVVAVFADEAWEAGVVISAFSPIPAAITVPVVTVALGQCVMPSAFTEGSQMRFRLEAVEASMGRGSQARQRRSLLSIRSCRRTRRGCLGSCVRC